MGYGVMNKLKDISVEWVKNKFEVFKGFFDLEDGVFFGLGVFVLYFGLLFVCIFDYGKWLGFYGDFYMGIDYVVLIGMFILV